MIYPRKTPKQAKEDEQAKKLITQQQRDQLKALVSQKLQDKYPTRKAESVQEKVDNFFEANHALTTENLKELDKNIADNTKAKNNANVDRDDVSVKSGVSKMSGATDFMTPEKADETGVKKDNMVIDLMLKTKKSSTKKFRNEEEEWADIYKYNQELYKAEALLEKDRKRFEKVKFKEELDEQVDIKHHKRQRELDEKRIDYEQIIMRINKDEQKEKKKHALEKAKMTFEKEMRDKQIKEIKAQRKQDLKEEKQLDAYIMNRIRQEQQEEERIAKKRRQEDYTNYRKMLQDNEEKRQKLFEERDRERREEIRRIEEQCRLVEEREKAREAEKRAKDEKIRQTLEAARQLIGKPSDERERRQEDKVQRYFDRKEEEELIQEIKEKQLSVQKRLENKAYLDKQVQEKEIRKQQENEERNEQAKIWGNSTAMYAEWEKKKADTRKEQMKSYADILKKQMHEKFEERRITDRLFNLRETLYENKQSSS